MKTLLSLTICLVYSSLGMCQNISSGIPDTVRGEEVLLIVMESSTFHEKLDKNVDKAFKSKYKGTFQVIDEARYSMDSSLVKNCRYVLRVKEKVFLGKKKTVTSTSQRVDGSATSSTNTYELYNIKLEFSDNETNESYEYEYEEDVRIGLNSMREYLEKLEVVRVGNRVKIEELASSEMEVGETITVVLSVFFKLNAEFECGKITITRVNYSEDGSIDRKKDKKILLDAVTPLVEAEIAKMKKDTPNSGKVLSKVTHIRELTVELPANR